MRQGLDGLNLRLVSWNHRASHSRGGWNAVRGWRVPTRSGVRGIMPIASHGIGFLRTICLLLATAIFLAACEDSMGRGNNATFATDPLHECSQEAFSRAARRYASVIVVTAPRDKVVQVLKSLALEVHSSHAPHQRCQYRDTIRLPVKRGLIDVLPLDAIGPAQTLSATIVSSSEVCVNYQDGVNDVEAGELGGYSWSWAPGDGILAGRSVKVFDPVCFSFE